jgi:hypothetical protein
MWAQKLRSKKGGCAGNVGREEAALGSEKSFLGKRYLK